MAASCATLLVLLVLLSPLLLAQERKSFIVPFHSVNGLILLDAEVNGKPAALLLDTGAQFAMVDQRTIGLVVNLRSFEMAVRGARGEYVKHAVTLNLAGFHWTHNVLIVNLGPTEKQFGAHIDGYVGEDLLREFSSVRLDYKANTVSFEK